jgi:hypothetical protein
MDIDRNKLNENIISETKHYNREKMKLWYEHPSVLLKNMNQYFPNNDLSSIEKTNALARFAIYYSIIVVVVGLDSKWLSVSVVIILISLFLGYTETFTDSSILTDKAKNNICQQPTASNPFMNYTLADQIDNPERTSACLYQDVKPQIRKNFQSKIHADETDMWGRNITERNFYIMPNTRMINDQEGFAKWCYNIYNDGATCKENGENCLIAIDPKYQQGRVTIKETDRVIL